MEIPVRHLSSAEPGSAAKYAFDINARTGFASARALPDNTFVQGLVPDREPARLRARVAGHLRESRGRLQPEGGPHDGTFPLVTSSLSRVH
jgi:hypothetical protein